MSVSTPTIEAESKAIFDRVRQSIRDRDDRPESDLPEGVECKPGELPEVIRELRHDLDRLDSENLVILATELRAIARARNVLACRFKSKSFREDHGLPPARFRPMTIHNADLYGIRPTDATGRPAAIPRWKQPATRRRKRIREDLLIVDPRCCYCERHLTLTTATLDHVHPVSKGGTDAEGNFVLACYACNQAKQDRGPIRWAFCIVAGVIRHRGRAFMAGVRKRKNRGG